MIQQRKENKTDSNTADQSASLVEDISSTHSIGHLDYRLVMVSDLIEENAIIRERLDSLEKKSQQLEKSLTNFGVRISKSKYDIFNEFIENLITIFPDKIESYKILNEYVDNNELLCWIIIPVKKSYKTEDFDEYNAQRLEIFKIIYDITEKYDNCSFTIVSDFEFKEIKNKIEVELEYLISDFI